MSIRVDLTPEQARILRPIMDKLNEYSDNGKPGMAVAQIHYDHILGRAYNHETALKVQEALGNYGAVTDIRGERKL